MLNMCGTDYGVLPISLCKIEGLIPRASGSVDGRQLKGAILLIRKASRVAFP